MLQVDTLCLTAEGGLLEAAASINLITPSPSL